MTIKILTAVAAVGALALAGTAQAQVGGGVDKAANGYSFEDASQEAAGTKDFHSKDGKLTFAIVTHTAGNGFFDPTLRVDGFRSRERLLEALRGSHNRD